MAAIYSTQEVEVTAKYVVFTANTTIAKKWHRVLVNIMGLVY